MGEYGVADTDNSWFLANGLGEGSLSLAAKILSTGHAYIKVAWHDGGMDYAESFETADGQPIEPGYFVTFDGAGDKVRKAFPVDGYILGVVSATPCVVGDAAELHWKKKYLTDKWGRVQYEQVSMEEEKDEQGNVLIPTHTDTRAVINPEWDSKKVYIPRSRRPEWVTVGLFGKLLLRDDGTCNAGGFCRPGAGGAATAADTGYRVLKRMDTDQILILFR